ncbi:hypothetical protein D9758_002555 [Tetrapyrgos nigripes]|uniref:Fcf2 pre-rRNA processing C-terminal domain-containing protein n=1 Tax=Tetrapyrgos nigripes TaxID=182062 RepID=A0A8H5GR35_9AGAR|nr:hypothetical protein D9758_002555 [Tetrapyrgos nigripes]
MSESAIQDGKGKEKAIDLTDPSDSDSTTDSDSDSSTSSDASDSPENEDATLEYLDALLEKAKKNAALAASITDKAGEGEDVLVLQNESKPPIPRLNPGPLPPSYFSRKDLGKDKIPSLRDPDAELATQVSGIPSAPVRPPELTKSGKALTKKEKKELKNKTAGSDWFDLPAPSEADLPRLYREVEALRLRRQMDPKRFYRREEGEGKGMKGLPKHFAIGTVVATNTPFGGASSENLTRAERKRTLVDELVDDAETKRYAKRKFDELQGVRGAKGKNTLQAKKAARKPKW